MIANFPIRSVNECKNQAIIVVFSQYWQLILDDWCFDLFAIRQWSNLSAAADRNGGGSRANPLALLIAPLAGIALLTAAAAVAINPVLVTVSVTGKRRKRRDLDTVIGGQEGISPELEEKIHEMQVGAVITTTRQMCKYLLAIRNIFYIRRC